MTRRFVVCGFDHRRSRKDRVFISLKMNSYKIILKIDGVEFSDYIAAKESRVGLIFFYDDQRKVEELEIHNWKNKW